MSIIHKFKEKYHNHVDYKLKTAIRHEMLNYCALHSKETGITDKKYCNENITVSLTTYGKRFYQVYLTIESLMQQSLKPNKIVLWVDYSFQNKRLPELLKKQQDRGLDICFCKDIRSYTKLIPSLQKYPNDVIITVDDDLYYSSNMIENLVPNYLDNPQYIYFNRGYRIKMLNNDKPDKYLNWQVCTTVLDVSPLNFPTGVGGVLYPPKCFQNEIFNASIFLNICPLADDVWFKAMALLNGTYSKKVSTFNANGEEYLNNRTVQDIGLMQQNVIHGQNDLQINAVFNKYNLWDKLKYKTH
jgi:hypothetical protein